MFLTNQGNSCLGQISDHGFDIATVIANFAVFTRLDLDERGLCQCSQTAGDLGLADSGGADQEDVLGVDIGGELFVELPSPPAIAERDSDRSLGLGLPDDVLVELSQDLLGGQGRVFGAVGWHREVQAEVMGKGWPGSPMDLP